MHVIGSNNCSKKKHLDETLEHYQNIVEKDGLAQLDALVRFHLKIETDNLTDEKLIELYAKVEWCIKQENKK